MSSKVLEILLLLSLQVCLSRSSSDDVWMDTRFDLKQINQNDFSSKGTGERNALDSNKINLDFATSSANRASAATNKTDSTDQRKIEDFQLNSAADTNDRTNSTLSATQHPRLFSLVLDPNGLLTLFWSVNHEQKHVLFELKFNLPSQVNAPFLAFGFSSYGQFENADLCVLWNDDKNKFHFQDTWTDANGFLNLDKQNDCELLSTKKVGNQIYLLFKRKLNTCDKHDFKLEKGTNHLIYALGNGQLEQVYGLRLSTIKRKGFVRASLFKSKQIPPVLNSGKQHLFLYSL